MRTNIEIDDKLMDFVMSTGEFKTKREAVEAGLKLIKRRHAYAAIRAARGTLPWDDSDEAWTRSRAEAEAEARFQATDLTQVQMGLAAPQAHDAAESALCEPIADNTLSHSPEAAPSISAASTLKNADATVESDA